MTAIIYLFFLRLLRLPFSPGYSAFTFPMVIGATALYKLSVLIGNWGFAARYAEQVHALATFELIVAALVIAYVSLHYLYNYLVRVRQADATPA